eukprot:gene14601-31073_t
MNVVKEIERINQRELDLGIFGGSGKGSWHEKYKDSAWVYFGGLPFDLSEGDIICVLSQWGEIEDINLVREKGTNKSMGFAFVKYEDQRSTILAVDNFNGIKLLGRTLRCDHVELYKLPKHIREKEEEELEANPDREVKFGPGHAYADKEMANEYSIQSGQDVWASVTSSSTSRNKKRIHEEDVDGNGMLDYEEGSGSGRRERGRGDDDQVKRDRKEKKEKKKNKDKHKHKHNKDRGLGSSRDRDINRERDRGDENFRRMKYKDKGIDDDDGNGDATRFAETLLVPQPVSNNGGGVLTQT